MFFDNDLNKLPDSIKYLHLELFEWKNIKTFNSLFYKLPSNIKVLDLITDFDFDDVFIPITNDKKIIFNKYYKEDKNYNEYLMYNIIFL